MSFPDHDSPHPERDPASRSDEPRLLTRPDQARSAVPPSRSILDRIQAGFASPPPDVQRVQPTSRPFSWLRGRKLVRLIAVLCVVAAALVLAGSIWLRHTLRAALPQIDGDLQTAGLSAPVRITRDAHGVPSLQAATLDDLLFAQGFVTAQDRLWQMDTLRRHAAGELSEILGERLVPHDRNQRLLQIRAAADSAIVLLPPDQLHQLEAYARGVNAYIALGPAHLPIEFHLLHYTPAPWTPRDTLLVSLAMFQDLSTEFPTKLLRETFSAHMPLELLADLYPVGSWRDHPPGQLVPDLTSPRGPVLQIPLDPSQSRLQTPSATPAELLEARASLVREICQGCRAGSNNWAVAGARSASGMPLVSTDMHLSLSVPDIWYEAGLHTADGALDVAGLTLPGVPFVIVGRNAHVAWTFTSMGGDVQDLYIEHLRGSGAGTEFQKPDGSWAAAGHHVERIRVRGGADVQLDVLTTTHMAGSAEMATPIISPLYPSERRALSLAWTIYDPANLSSPFLAINAATNGAALTAAFTNFGGPSLNLIYADDANHIGYHALGRIPIRGPAVQHPIAPPPDLPIPGTPPPPSDEESFAVDPFHPRHLLAAAFLPRNSRRRPQPQPKPQAAPSDAALPEAPPAPLYTIGSPIPAVPVDALDPNAQWSGYVPYAELPAAADPLSGLLATANSRITPDGYPYALALDWATPYRVERITHLLENSTGLTPADMLRTQMDVHSELDLALARRIAYALDHSHAVPKDAKRLRQAADILRQWKGDVTPDAVAPSIVAATRSELWDLLLPPQIAAHDRAAHLNDPKAKPAGIARLYTWAEQNYALEQMVLHNPARWLPPGVANWDDLLAAAVDRGLNSAHAPADLAGWRYGKLHAVEINHPLLSPIPLLARLLGVKAGSGPRPVGGNTSTIMAMSHTFGPTERLTADLANPDATTSNLTTGQSGNPASPWYMDQLPLWLGGTTLPLPLHAAPAGHTLTLHP
jgi:penicillin amidase